MESPKIVPKGKRHACAHHPRYEASRPPRKDCPVCWGAYLKTHYGLDIKDVLTPRVVRISDLKQAGEFVISLKAALSKAHANGGIYSAFLKTNDGDAVQIEIQESLTREKW